MKKQNLINAHTVFVATLVVIGAMVLIVYIAGLHQHRSLYFNAILSTSILSFIFFLFITIGLYRGWKLKDNVGNLLDRFDRLPEPSTVLADNPGLDPGAVDADGIEGCLFSIISWIIIGVFGTIILWSIGAVLWGMLLAIAGLLYWIIFRAYRLIFKNASSCRNDLFKSLKIGILYSFLYSCWIYAIIFGTHYLQS